MNRIIVAFNGVNMSQSALDYAVNIAESTKSRLVGVFLRDIQYLGNIYNYGFGEPYIDLDQLSTDSVKNRDLRKKNMRQFMKVCDSMNIEATIHFDKGTPARELIHESAWADLIITSSNTSFFPVYSDIPNSFLQDVLTESHCPVLIVPEAYEPIKSVCLTYDGSPTAMHAIKMFSYVFKEWRLLPVELVSAYAGKENTVPEMDNLKEFMEKHFDRVNFQFIKNGNVDKLLKHIETSRKNRMVVMGAFGRNAISRFIHRSTSEKVIRDIQVPVFIAHH